MVKLIFSGFHRFLKFISCHSLSPSVINLFLHFRENHVCDINTAHGLFAAGTIEVNVSPSGGMTTLYNMFLIILYTNVFKKNQNRDCIQMSQEAMAPYYISRLCE